MHTVTDNGVPTGLSAEIVDNTHTSNASWTPTGTAGTTAWPSAICPAGQCDGYTYHTQTRSSLGPAALAHSASFRPATVSSPHPVASFLSVAGCGTRPSSGIRQNRRPLTESPASAPRLS